MVLPTNVDATYADSGTDASQKTHQQHHDTIHDAVNAVDGAYADAVANGFVGTKQAWLEQAGDGYAPGGTDVAVADGGTGASTAGGARTNLGVVIGTDVQAYDADLDALAAIAGVEGDIIYRNATTWTRLPKGTASQVLAMNAGATAPEWAAASGGGGGGALTPRFIARRITTDATLTSGSSTTVVFNSETEDTASAYDTATGQYTIPTGQGGTWKFGTNLTLVGVDSASRQFHTAVVFVNGASVLPRLAQTAAPASSLDAGSFLPLGGESPYIVAAGDVITLRVSAVGSAPKARAADSFFWGHKIG